MLEMGEMSRFRLQEISGFKRLDNIDHILERVAYGLGIMCRFSVISKLPTSEKVR